MCAMHKAPWVCLHSVPSYRCLLRSKLSESPQSQRHKFMICYSRAEFKFSSDLHMTSLKGVCRVVMALDEPWRLFLLFFMEEVRKLSIT